MKEWRITVQSYLSNNSDYAEYDVYYTTANTKEEAKADILKYIGADENNTKDGVIYNIYSIEEC